MGRFLIWLSGARRQILDECPTERPKYVGIGASILITATLAAVSLAFALVTALKVEFWLAMPFAIGWGLAILSLDRLFVVSLSREGGRRAQILRATPRVLLALLLGFVISTPFVLQIFRPEIEHEITQLQDQAAVNYFNSLKTSPLSKEIASQGQQVAKLQAEAAGTGAGTSTAQSPALARLEQQRSDLLNAQNTALNRYDCQLYGPCKPPGNGPIAKNYDAQYQSDGTQIDALNTQISQLQQQQQTATQKQESLIGSTASSQLARAESALNADITEQQRETDDFVAKNRGDTGLLIRLQALSAVTAGSFTLNAARWLLFLLFVVIDCMPVMIKVMLNLGPANNYDVLLKAEEHSQRLVAANKTAVRLATETMAAGTAISEAQSRLTAWNTPIPEVTENIIAARRLVAAEEVEAWKEARIRRLRDEDAAMRGQATGPFMGSILTGADTPPWRWWRRRRSGGSQRPHGARSSDGTLQPAGPGKPDHDEHPGTPRRGESTPNKIPKWLNPLVTYLIIPLALAGIGWWLSVQLTHLADQQTQNGISLADQQHKDDVEATYLADMRDSLFNQHLSTSPADSDVRQAAIEETVTTLKLLDWQRNAAVLRFLRDEGLIGGQDEVIDLSGADLSGADLRNVNLAGVTMDGADLTNAHLHGATLTGASLSDAILTDADLTGARLGGAVLTSAELSGANLRGAILAGADLAGAKIKQQQFNEVNSCRDVVLPPAGIKCNRTPIISLTYWYTESGNEPKVIINTLIPQFQRKYPSIHINAVSENFYDTRAKFTAAAQDGHPPDVLRSDLSWTKLFAQKGYLLNIDPYAYQDQSDLNLADYGRLNPPFGPDLSPAGTKFSPLTYDKYNGHLYGLPQVTDVQALLYNKKELMDAGITGPPQNMTQFEADVVRVAQQNKREYGFETDGTFAKALPFLYACGGGLLGQRNNNILLNDQGSVSGLNFLDHLQKKGNVKPVYVNLANGGQISPIVTDFMKGKTAMIFDGPYDVSEILTGSSFSHDHDNLGVAGIPMGPGGQVGSPLGGQSYVISSSTAYPAEAYEFIKFMSSTNSQITIAKANYTLPTRWSATRMAVSSNPFIKQFLSIWETQAVARPAIPKAAYLFDVADPSIQAALTGKLGPSQALNNIANAWNQLGAGNEISQPASTPGASQTACS